jgi:hypothetical protein
MLEASRIWSDWSIRALADFWVHALYPLVALQGRSLRPAPRIRLAVCALTALQRTRTIAPEEALHEQDREEIVALADGVSADMQGYGDQIADEDIWHLVDYIRSLAR